MSDRSLECGHRVKVNISPQHDHIMFFFHNWDGKSNSHIENDMAMYNMDMCARDCVCKYKVYTHIDASDGRNGVGLKLEYMFISPQWAASSRKLTRQTSIK